jgi:hypothetical protein
VDVAFERFRVEKPADEKHFLAIIGEWSKNFSKLHALALPLGPPLLRVEAIAREENAEADRRIARRMCGGRLVAPDGNRLEPRQCHGDPDAAEKRPT